MSNLNISITLMVCIFGAVLGTLVAWLSRGITYYGADTDCEKQVCAAAHSAKWRWLSDMHKYGNKTRMKDIVIILLAVSQRLLRDRTSCYPLVVLCIVANIISAFLLYLIAGEYWGANIGLLVFFLSIACVWPWQIALFGGHVCISQMFFFLSVYLIQRAETAIGLPGVMCFVATGFSAGLMLFSSASSRKYLPLIAGAFFYGQRGVFVAPWQTHSYLSMFSGEYCGVFYASLVVLLCGIILRLSYREVVMLMYNEKAPNWLNSLIEGRQDLSLGHYVLCADKYSLLVVKTCVLFVFYSMACATMVNSWSFYWSQLYVVTGLVLVVLLLTLPNVAVNLKAYYVYARLGKPTYSRFRLYEEHFARLGKPISSDMRGAGLIWIIKYFSRIIPFHSVLYLACLLVVLLVSINSGEQYKMLKAVVIMAFSLSPIIVGEISRGPQIGRSYYPGFVGLLLLIAYSAFQINMFSPYLIQIVFWLLCILTVLSGGVWAIWLFLTDVLPARMAPLRLGQSLDKLKIKKIHTYNTPYNDAFVDALRLDGPQKYEIIYINTLKEVKDGFIAVPGTSSKAFNMESEQWSIRNGDFDLDQGLNRLLETKEISKYSVASFKTFGTSRVWVHESEVTSYRDLIINEISEYDRWRSHGWLLDAAMLNADTGI